jgi:hypothetical protein
MTPLCDSFPENFDTRKNQLSRQGFMELNLMEASERGGDPTDLWVTLEAMGYNRNLEMVEVGPSARHTHTYTHTHTH